MGVPKGFFPSGHGFERLRPKVADGVAMMVARRHFAGIAPFACEGLPLGYWDDCFGPSSIVPMSWDMVRCLVFLMFARDVARIRAGVDRAPEALPAIHVEVSAIMEADGWTVASAVKAARALEAAGDPFFGPPSPLGSWREARDVSCRDGVPSWFESYGRLAA